MKFLNFNFLKSFGPFAVVVQLGERQTEDLDVAGSSPAYGTFFIEEYLVLLYTNYFFKNKTSRF